MSKSKQSLCFTITGEFLTQQARTLWADENQPEKALDLLEAAFPTMSEEVRLLVITGKKKLTGDSNIGIEVESDDCQVTRYGNNMGIKQMIERFREREDALLDRIQMAENITESVPSPKGLIKVPQRRTKKGAHPTTGLNQGNVLNIPYEELNKIPHYKVESAIQNIDKHKHKKLCPILDPESKSMPPEHLNYISQDNGWLSLDGKFYPCLYGGHRNIAYCLGEHQPELNHELVLEKLGWVKVQQGSVFLNDYDRTLGCVTQAQRDIIFDWYKERGRELPFWMKPDNIED